MDRHEVVSSFYRSRRAKNCRPKTLVFYRWVLSKLDEGPLPTTPEEVEEVLGDPELGDESRWDLWRGLRTFFRWASARYRIPNPMEAVERPRRRRPLPRYLHEEQVARVWWACRTPQEEAVIALLLDSGLRIGEVASIRPEDIGLTKLTVRGKSGKRQVSLSPAVRERLLALVRGEQVWRGRKGPLTVYGLTLLVRRVLRRAGVKGGPHLLRHTFAVMFLKREGANLVALQRLLGHADLETTRIYLELLDADVDEAHRKASPVQFLLSLPRPRQGEFPAAVQLSLAMEE